MKHDRRQFLRRAGALSSAGLARRLGAAGLASLASAAAAQSAPSDYKALVCVFLFGGVDGNSLLVPLDAAGFGRYAAVRTESSGLQIPQAQWLPIQPAGSATPYGLHPEFAELQPLFAAGKLALVANVGTLNEPTTRANYAAARPDSLYSHSDQQSQWQSAVSDGPSRTGWGGRLADRVASLNGKRDSP